MNWPWRGQEMTISHKGAMMWLWSGQEVTMKKPLGGHHVGIKRPWSVHQVAMEWPWSEYDMIRTWLWSPRDHVSKTNPFVQDRSFGLDKSFACGHVMIDNILAVGNIYNMCWCLSNCEIKPIAVMHIFSNREHEPDQSGFKTFLCFSLLWIFESSSKWKWQMFNIIHSGHGLTYL